MVEWCPDLDTETLLERHVVHLNLLLFALLSSEYALEVALVVVVVVGIIIGEEFILDLDGETILDDVRWFEVEDGLTGTPFVASYERVLVGGVFELECLLLEFDDLLQVDEGGEGIVVLLVVQLEAEVHEGPGAVEGDADGSLRFDRQLDPVVSVEALEQPQLNDLVGLVVDHGLRRDQQQLASILGHHLDVQTEGLHAALERDLPAPE